MANQALIPVDLHTNALAGVERQQFVTIEIDGQLFGIPVLLVQDVMRPRKITHIPLAPPAVCGALNLRGRIMTVVDVRSKLGLTPTDLDAGYMNVVVEHEGELYSLVVDKVGEVLKLAMEGFEHNPSTLSPVWQDVSHGVYRLQDRLLLVLDIKNLLDFE